MKKISCWLAPFLLTGCTMVGPDFVPPESPRVTSYTGEAEAPDGDDAPKLVLKTPFPDSGGSCFNPSPCRGWWPWDWKTAPP